MTKLTWDTAPETLTTRQAAQLLGITRLHTISDLCAKGEIKAQRTGKIWRISRDYLRQKYATRLTLSDQLDTLELTLATLAAQHRQEPIAAPLNLARQALTDALAISRGETPTTAATPTAIIDIIRRHPAAVAQIIRVGMSHTYLPNDPHSPVKKELRAWLDDLAA